MNYCQPWNYLNYIIQYYKITTRTENNLIPGSRLKAGLRIRMKMVLIWIFIRPSRQTWSGSDRQGKPNLDPTFIKTTNSEKKILRMFPAKSLCLNSSFYIVTVYPRSLEQFYIVTYYAIWVKNSTTYYVKPNRIGVKYSFFILFSTKTRYLSWLRQYQTYLFVWYF